MSTRYQALPGNADPEALPPIFTIAKSEAEPLDMGFQAEPRNQLDNLLIMSITLLILLDAPKSDRYEWFDLRRLVRLKVNEQIFWGVTTFISEVGVHVEMTQAELPAIVPGETLPVTVTILEYNLKLQGQITRADFSGEFPSVQIHFDQLELTQHRCLVEMLFCRPGQWKLPCAPGELKSLFLLFGILLKPRILFDRDRAIDFVKVSKG